ncbi:MAG: hypothetical protein EOP86_00810 [Verrucomicrobiaceae bacterium]|nr:MAG: hypothetical protein EOP86_00810 [Verrucomicrobiaceae bacterium]
MDFLLVKQSITAWVKTNGCGKEPKVEELLAIVNAGTKVTRTVYQEGRERGQAFFSQGTGHEDRWTLGTRLFGKRGPGDFNDEAMLQGGRFAGGDILAWSLATDHGFTWEHLPGKPRLTLAAAATHFLAGPFIKDQQGADVDYGSVWVTWQF